MRLLLIASLILFSATGVASAQTQGIFDPFDRWYGNKSTEEENIRLDNFSVALERNPDLIGYILVYAGKTSCEGETQRHATRMKNYVVTVRGIGGDRVIARDAGFLSEPTVILEPMTREATRAFFSYSSRTKEHVVQRCTRTRTLR